VLRATEMLRGKGLLGGSDGGCVDGGDGGSGDGGGGGDRHASAFMSRLDGIGGAGEAGGAGVYTTGMVSFDIQLPWTRQLTLNPKP
jgi:hypothetical protein